MVKEKREGKKILFKGVLFATAIALTTACSSDEKKTLTQEYAVMTITTAPTSIDQVFPATINGTQDIEIRSQVEGFIINQYVDEGENVKMGKLLFEIDPSTYEADYNLAVANVAAAKTQVETARLTADNKANLARKGIISDYEKELAFNQLETSIAILKQNEAAMNKAKSNLDFTCIKSPADGVIGSLPFANGSLVGPTTATALTVVSDINRIDVHFSLNEKQLFDLNSRHDVSLDKLPDVKLRLADGTIHSETGRVRTISGVIDINTGAANAVARFKNPNRTIRSGSSGAVLIPYKNDSALIIPQNATFEVQDKKFVCLLNDSNVVSNREIKVLAQSDGENYIVTDGLVVGDRIVIEGVGVSVKNGMQITPITAEEAKAKLDKAVTTTKESATEE